MQASPAKGQAQVNALLNPDVFGSDDLDDFAQVIHAADPQARRARGILAIGRASAAPQGTNATYPFTSQAGGPENRAWSIHADDHVSEPGVSWALSPPASLLIEQADSDESVGDDLDASPEEGSIYSSSAASSPGSKGSFYLPYWDAIQDLEAAYTAAAAEYDSDASTTSGAGSTMFGSMFASAMYDGDAPEVDLGGLTASTPSSRKSSVQGNPGLPGAAGSSVSQDPGPSVGQTSHVPTMFCTSVVSFSVAPPTPSVGGEVGAVTDEEGINLSVVGA